MNSPPSGSANLSKAIKKPQPKPGLFELLGGVQPRPPPLPQPTIGSKRVAIFLLIQIPLFPAARRIAPW
jgi:hypothetical protein